MRWAGLGEWQTATTEPAPRRYIYLSKHLLPPGPARIAGLLPTSMTTDERVWPSDSRHLGGYPQPSEPSGPSEPLCMIRPRQVKQTRAVSPGKQGVAGAALGGLLRCGRHGGRAPVCHAKGELAIASAVVQVRQRNKGTGRNSHCFCGIGAATSVWLCASRTMSARLPFLPLGRARRSSALVPRRILSYWAFVHANKSASVSTPPDHAHLTLCIGHGPTRHSPTHRTAL